MNVLVLVGGCWINQERGKPPKSVGDLIEELLDTGTCDEEEEEESEEEPGECDPDDDSGECWDPPDPGL